MNRSDYIAVFVGMGVGVFGLAAWVVWVLRRHQ